MTSIDLSLLTVSWQALAWALLAGCALGLLYFASLWVSTNQLVRSKRPLLWMLLGLVLRMAVVLPGFYWFSDAQWQKLLACVLGFIIARFIVIRATGKLAAPRPDWEDKHAS